MACSPSETPAPEPSMNYQFVPIWRADTMINGYRISGTDTMYAFTIGDTSCIKYGSDTLYVFGIFDTTRGSSQTAFIGPDPLDSATAYSRCVIRYYRWYNVGDNKYTYAQQAIGITARYPHFATTGDAWYLGR